MATELPGDHEELDPEKLSKEELAYNLGKFVEEHGQLPVEAIRNLILEDKNLREAFTHGAQDAQSEEQDRKKD